MKDNIFIKKCTEINDEEFKCVFNKLNDTDKIKVLKDPFFGHFGIVTKIINDEVTFESGVICRALQIKLENGEITLVPKANIEVI